MAKPGEAHVGADDEERRRFACPPARGEFEGIDLSFLDPADPDDRSFLIRAEHPELAAAIRRDEDEVVVGGAAMNPHLHVALHEAVASQLWNDDPPEVWQTARRLREAGYERHEILHMLASALTAEIWSALHENQPYAHDRYVRALEALPESWEAQRPM